MYKKFIKRLFDIILSLIGILAFAISINSNININLF